MTLKILLTFLTLQFLAPVAIASTKNYSGHYKLQLDIQGKVYMDELILEKNLEGKYTGKYIVPGSFESEVIDFLITSDKFDFKIHVIEGSADYFSLFRGSITDEKIQGSAYILPAMELLGVFEGRKQ